MKKRSLLPVIFLLTLVSYGQKKEKVIGNKVVTIENHEVGYFNAVEIEDNLNVFIEKGASNVIKIEADSNLQDAIAFDLIGKKLRVYYKKNPVKFKKFVVKIVYDESFKTVTSKNESTVNVVEAARLDTINFIALDKSKLYLNVNSTNLNIKLNNKSTAELNSTSDKTNIIMSNESSIKALIGSGELKLDMYQQSTAVVEGDAIKTNIRVDNSASLVAENLFSKKLTLTAEGYSKSDVYAEDNLVLYASDNSKVNVYGEPKVDLLKFSGESTIFKKKTKMVVKKK